MSADNCKRLIFLNKICELLTSCMMYSIKRIEFTTDWRIVTDKNQIFPERLVSILINRIFYNIKIRKTFFFCSFKLSFSSELCTATATGKSKSFMEHKGFFYTNITLFKVPHKYFVIAVSKNSKNCFVLAAKLLKGFIPSFRLKAFCKVSAKKNCISLCKNIVHFIEHVVMCM